MFYIIDNVKKIAIRATTDWKLAMAQGFHLCKGDYTIVGQRRDMAAYSIGLLADIFKNMTGKKLPIVNGYNEMIQLAWTAVEDNAPQEGPTLAELIKKYGEVPAVDPKPTFDGGKAPYNPEKDPDAAKAREKRAAEPRAEKAPRAAASGGVAPTRPRAGTTTARVWDIADTALQGGAEGKALRAQIVAACVAEGIDPSTAATQYSKWNRARVAS